MPPIPAPPQPAPPIGPRTGRRPAAGERPAWYQIGPVVALAEDPEPGSQETGGTSSSADVYVYDTIGGWWGMTADDFVRDVASLDVDQLVLHLNTPGGDAMEGIAIANVLRAHRARIVVRVDGYACSAGSAIAMAGDEIIMGIGSQMMIHDAAGWAIGNEAEVLAYAKRLASTSNAYASAYAAKAGGAAADWREVMRAESWYTAEEAVAAGLADRVATADETGTAEGEQITPGASSGFWDMWDSLATPERFDMNAYASAFAYSYAGRQHAPAPAMPGRQTPAASADRSTTTQERSRAVAFSDEQLTNLRQRLGTADDADEAAILAALDARLTEPAPPTNPPGTVAVDEATHAQLIADARDGREARAQQLAEKREKTVRAAVIDGRIPAARKQHWIDQLTADPGAEATLAGLKPGLVPVDGEIGYASDEPKDSADPAAGDDYWFAGVPTPRKTTEG